MTSTGIATLAFAIALGCIATATPTTASADPLKACGVVSRRTGEVPERSTVQPHLHFVAVCCITPAIVSVDTEPPAP
jgi:hypothetical protein